MRGGVVIVEPEAALCEFTIPMRGNETDRSPERPKSMPRFTIPMRGNEAVTDADMRPLAWRTFTIPVRAMSDA